MPARSWIFVVALLLPCWALAPARAADAVKNSPAADLIAARQKLRGEYSAQLNALADQYRKLGEAKLERRTRDWLPPRDADKIYIYVLPESLAAEASLEQSARELNNREPQPREPANPEKTVRRDQWQTRFHALRRQQADALWALAQQAATAHCGSLAYELASEAAHENPDLVPARRLLGYVLDKDAWRTRYEIQQSAAGKVWHAKFGWLPKQHVARYEQGERFFQRRWMPAAEEAALRSDIEQGWQVETAHYLVTTNHSLEEGVQLATRLERLHACWSAIFAPYLTSDAEIERRFAGKGVAARDDQRHQVIEFRTRKEYNDALVSQQPQIAITLGIYFDDSQAAYFFAGAEQEQGTLYHEATHQLFQEARGAVRQISRKDNFWLIEGIACFMETLSEQPGYSAVGGRLAGRLPAARQRALNDRYYVPLAELSGFGVQEIQQSRDITRLYSESAGLAAFFMQGEGSRYREPLIQTLSAIYTSHADRDTLATGCGASFGQLDAEYLRFLRPQ